MKTLLVLRHAKSDHGIPGLADHDRPLNERGRRDAPRVGQRLLAAGLMPDVILASTAVRAKTTAEQVAEACGFSGDICYRSELYLAPPRTYLAALAELENRVSLAMVVGHNPGLEELLHLAAGEYREFPTAALARLEFDIAAWPEIQQARGKLSEIWLARDE